MRHAALPGVRFVRFGMPLFAALTTAAPLPAQAEVRVAGTPAAVRVVAERDQVTDVLAAMATAFNLRYRASIPLERAISGTYAGSLKDVLARVLDGYSYVIRHAGEATDIIIFGRSGTEAVASQPPPAATKTFASQWR
jgi:hypothetical protein